MENEIGTLIANCRTKLGLTQDQFGRKYGVSGPAIFKFEKGYVKPSLELWLRIAKDLNLSEQAAVMMHVKAKLPKKYQVFINVESAAVQEEEPKYAKKKVAAAPAVKPVDAKEIRKKVLADASTPQGLKQLLKDEDLWALYKPTGHEIQVLRDVFGTLGGGTKSAYREALRLVREFSGE